MSQLFSAREHDGEVGQIELPEGSSAFLGSSEGCQGFAQQAQLAVAAFKSGLAASANLNLGGFDTHSNHDRDQVQRHSPCCSGGSTS